MEGKEGIPRGGVYHTESRIEQQRRKRKGQFKNGIVKTILSESDVTLSLMP